MKVIVYLVGAMVLVVVVLDDVDEEVVVCEGLGVGVGEVVGDGVGVGVGSGWLTVSVAESVFSLRVAVIVYEPGVLADTELPVIVAPGASIVAATKPKLFW